MTSDDQSISMIELSVSTAETILLVRRDNVMTVVFQCSATYKLMHTYGISSAAPYAQFLSVYGSNIYQLDREN
jgi:hypothetical protein